jgi:hypothetical protein
MPLARLNPREFLQAEKEDQEMAEACKRALKPITSAKRVLI